MRKILGLLVVSVFISCSDVNVKNDPLKVKVTNDSAISVKVVNDGTLPTPSPNQQSSIEYFSTVFRNEGTSFQIPEKRERDFVLVSANFSTLKITENSVTVDVDLKLPTIIKKSQSAMHNVSSAGNYYYSGYYINEKKGNK